MRVVVVGAGLAGLAAAIDLTGSGHDVIVFDKGRSPGGRMASRRIGAARVDHGAQFFTIRSDEFASFVRPHLERGLVYEWCRGFSATGDGYPRYAVHDGMNTLPKVMAKDLDVRCNSLVFAVRRGSAGAPPWNVSLDDGTSLDADAIVLTSPLPQSYSLLVSAEVELQSSLVRTDYDRTIALLATLDSAPAIEEPGGMQDPTPAISFAADNQRKGVSRVPAVTIHANAAWSEAHWSDSIDLLASNLIAEAADLLGTSRIVEHQVKKWRFATPRSIWPEPFWAAPSDGTIVLAGDAFAGPRVEGAVLSGKAAARHLSQL